jgi:hypothetical protein
VRLEFSTFRVGLKLKKTFDRRKNGGENENATQLDKSVFQSAKTKDLLPEADFTDIVPTTVTENTTKHLSEKFSKKSS